VHQQRQHTRNGGSHGTNVLKAGGKQGGVPMEKKCSAERTCAGAPRSRGVWIERWFGREGGASLVAGTARLLRTQLSVDMRSAHHRFPPRQHKASHLELAVSPCASVSRPREQQVRA